MDIDDEEYMSDNEDEIRKEQLDYSLEEDVIYDEVLIYFICSPKFSLKKSKIL